MLILSLFPGLGLLDRAFEECGACVVQGPDLILARDIRTFVGVTDRFDGVIAGTPCQDFSKKRRVAPSGYGLEMLHEFARVVTECGPVWWLLENVPGVPDVFIPGWVTQRFDVENSAAGGSQFRLRHFQLGHRAGWIARPLRSSVTPRPVTRPLRTVLCVAPSTERSFAEQCRRQGFDRPVKLPGWSQRARMRAVGNGVPLPMGRLVAKAVLGAGPVTEFDCVCLCGRQVTPPARHATAACRKRMERRRRGHRTYFIWPGDLAGVDRGGALDPCRAAGHSIQCVQVTATRPSIGEPAIPPGPPD